MGVHKLPRRYEKASNYPRSQGKVRAWSRVSRNLQFSPDLAQKKPSASRGPSWRRRAKREAKSSTTGQDIAIPTGEPPAGENGRGRVSRPHGTPRGGGGRPRPAFCRVSSRAWGGHRRAAQRVPARARPTTRTRRFRCFLLSEERRAPRTRESGGPGSVRAAQPPWVKGRGTGVAHSQSHTLTLTLVHTHTHNLPHSQTQSQSYTFAPPHSLTQTLTLTLTHSHTLVHGPRAERRRDSRPTGTPPANASRRL